MQEFIIKVKETWGNKSFELWYSFLYSWWKDTMKGQTILILLPEVSHSSCCQCYSVVYLAKARLHQLMAIASKNELKGGMDALCFSISIFHFPETLTVWKPNLMPISDSSCQSKCYGNSKYGREFSFMVSTSKTSLLGECVTALSYSLLLQSHCILCFPSFLCTYPPIVRTTLEKI